MHYNRYLNNYKGEGWPWASFPAIHSRYYLWGVNRPVPKSWPPRCDIKQLFPGRGHSAHISPAVLITSWASWWGWGLGVLFEVQGSSVYSMCGKENRFVSHGEHPFHENWNFQEEEVSFSTSNNKNSYNSNPHGAYKAFTGVRHGTRNCLTSVLTGR